MKKIRTENIFFILLWAVLYLVFLFQLLPQSSVVEAILFPALFVVSAYPITMYLSRNLLPKAIRTKKMKGFILQYIIYSIVVGVIFFLYLLLFSHLESRGILPVSEYFNIVNLPAYYLSIFLSAGFLINLCFCGLGFYSAHLKLEKAHLEAQLQTLQAQITPHFMFNVLNHVHILIKKDPNLADDLLLQYTDILRYQLYSGKQDHITIEQEVQFLKNFIDVEAIRWKNKLDINCIWEIENTNIEFPPLLLITFVENAFKHVSRSDSTKGYVNISLKQEGKIVCFNVENSNSDFTLSKKKDSGIGLVNAKRRLDILFPNKYSLTTECNDMLYSTHLIVNL